MIPPRRVPTARRREPARFPIMDIMELAPRGRAPTHLPAPDAHRRTSFAASPVVFSSKERSHVDVPRTATPELRKDALMALSVGDTAPDFTLVSDERIDGGFRPYHLAEALQQGPVILHFFPAPFTRTCELQMTGVRDHVEDVYGAQGVKVWGVTGHYPWMIQAWDREHHFGVPVLADYEHEVSEAYVGTYADLLGLRHTTKRGVVGVATDGTVRYVWTTEDPGVAPSDETIQAAIDAARA